MAQQDVESQELSASYRSDAIADELHKDRQDVMPALSQGSQAQINVDSEAVLDRQQTSLKSSSQILARAGSSVEVSSGSFPRLLSQTQSTLKDEDHKTQAPGGDEEDEAVCVVLADAPGAETPTGAQEIPVENLPHVSSTAIHRAESQSSGHVAEGESKQTQPLDQWPPPFHFFGTTHEDYDACCESFWCPCITAGRNAKKADTCSWLTVPLCCLMLIHYALIVAGCVNGYWLLGSPVVQLIVTSFLWTNRRRIAEAYGIQTTQDVWPTCFFLYCGCWFIPLIQEAKIVQQPKVLVGESVMLGRECGHVAR
eukprot:TRINITY_DN19854_c0_g1_i1.p1 TRINITY_DN19854_c0_g1~~TRINITY_DN19854_c0_g1_i1.p1  ORF type:complete len:337 (-),score=54.86 TRINITY_DN19854_c0_g1_i1:57-989(-)